ncbi:sorting nexin-3 isoform X1 [Papio anubis]|uniref:Sorting nexin 3 n=1 Tax=Piliocolobus tephrosceles TaxID=591936 RepID=A0A8C9G9R7_9PRIM|nr:PREDICTED: sorting nexin-3 isoform X1 [Cercocebus atys]XP_031522705.1 sorting nexin-3 isoform X1 [Papio anubis]XP_031523409.1 sorting nexin-3 isoform X1 [Papio anubis]
MAETVADTRRLITKPQNLNDAYGPPSNFLEIDVSNPQTVGVGRGRFTTYEIRVKTNLPIFKLKESTVRRRYSDFEWLRSELERESKVVVPPLPGKAFLRQLPFRGDDGIFDDNFIEERKQGLEQFINKFWPGAVDHTCNPSTLGGRGSLVILWHRMNVVFTCFYKMK